MLGTWREKFRRRGLTQISTWVPREIADDLQRIFARIGAQSLDGDSLRGLLGWLSTRRRAVAQRFDGHYFRLEIDDPGLRFGTCTAPIGGRIVGEGRTLIELDPFEARALQESCQSAIMSILVAWLEEQNLNKKIRDDTGVIEKLEFVLDNTHDFPKLYKNRPNSIQDFEKNEAKIAQEFQQRAFYNGAIPPDDPSIYHYIGFHGTPSRCHLVHGTFDGKICVGFIHIKSGGTSPTNMIENLCKDFYTKKLNDISMNEIQWYDIWPSHHSLTDKLQISRVIFEKNTFENPSWFTDEPPEGFHSKIIETIQFGITAEIKAFMKRHPNEKWIHLISEEKRKGYGKFHVDVLIDSNPRVCAVLSLGSWPRETERFGKPCLFVTRPGAFDFRDEESCNGLIKHWKDDATILERDFLIESWEDYDLINFCKRAELPYEKARQYYAMEAKK